MKTIVALSGYLLITAIMFVGIDHFMSNEQGLIALPIAVIWLLWTTSIGSFTKHRSEASSALDSGYSTDAATYWHYSKDFD